jgi:hypothetical protein
LYNLIERKASLFSGFKKLMKLKKKSRFIKLWNDRSAIFILIVSNLPRHSVTLFSLEKNSFPIKSMESDIAEKLNVGKLAAHLKIQ